MYQLKSNARLMIGILLVGSAAAMYTYHLNKPEIATNIVTSTISLLIGILAGSAMVKRSSPKED